jgi:hypothetical protein
VKVMVTTTRRVPTPAKIEAIALAATAHPHTVERRLLQLPVRGQQ